MNGDFSMRRYQTLTALLMLGLFATAVHAEPPTSGPKLGEKIVPLKRGHVNGKICWSCFG
jgi:hypothetical protein